VKSVANSDPDSTKPLSLPFEYRLTTNADKDFIDVLDYSETNFGSAAASRYEILILEAIKYVTKYPLGIGTKDKPEAGVGSRYFHLRGARDLVLPPRNRVQNPSHFLLYRIEGNIVAIGRILHEAELPERHISEETWRLDDRDSIN